MKRHPHALDSSRADKVDASVLTTVELLWLEKRIENRLRFGRHVSEKVLDRNRRVLSFPPGSIFAFRAASLLSSVGRPTTSGPFSPALISCAP
jgi:hypothetical protein